VLEIAARAYVLEEGRVVAESASSVLRQEARIEQTYLGLRGIGSAQEGV